MARRVLRKGERRGSAPAPGEEGASPPRGATGRRETQARQRVGAAPPGTGTHRGGAGESRAAPLPASTPLHSPRQEDEGASSSPTQAPFKREQSHPATRRLPRVPGQGTQEPFVRGRPRRARSRDEGSAAGTATGFTQRCQERSGAEHQLPGCREPCSAPSLLSQETEIPRALPDAFPPCPGTRLGGAASVPREPGRSHLYCLALSMYSCCSMPWESAADTSMMLLRRHKTAGPAAGSSLPPSPLPASGRPSTRRRGGPQDFGTPK